jgi:spermidine synthase
MRSKRIEDYDNSWRYEGLNAGLYLATKVSSTIFSGTSPFQKIQVLDTPSLGRCLILDGKTQSAEVDEFIYHESLVHPALLTHPRPSSVCIAGGGEGATAREILKHTAVKDLLMIDLDPTVVEVCRKYLGNLHQGAFEDPRLTLCFGDAREFFQNSASKFDVIVLDLADPTESGPAGKLYTKEFYALLAKRLNAGGLIVTQAGPASLINHREVFTAIYNTLEQVFPVVCPYAVSIQSFGENWGFAMAFSEALMDKISPEDVDKTLRSRNVFGLRSYDSISHGSLFALPPFLRQALASETRVITDSAPLFIY